VSATPPPKLQLDADRPDVEPVERPSHAPARFADGTARTSAVAPQRSQLAADLADLELDFERALRSLTMAFQPIVRPDGALYGYEALMRSADPALPHPGAILDAAERLSRLERLGRNVRASTARAFAEADPSRGLVFVNVHALDLLDRSLSSPYSPLAKLASRVVLEITERASLDNVPDVRYRVAELREMGYRIAIDDLGAGHSRMNQFRPLDTDFVKLDMSLVRNIDGHPVKQQLVSSVTSLCRDQRILVIGEGVETAAEAETLIRLGCDLLQGYFIARPGPPFPDPALRAA
jgi:EAL domain-containing protein (putative c-di-GMP-specific phosphodiesterase class I)